MVVEGGSHWVDGRECLWVGLVGLVGGEVRVTDSGEAR